MKAIAFILTLTFINGIYIFRAADKTRAAASVSPKEAKELYKQNCARCHGMNGRSETELGQTLNAPDLTDPAWQAKLSNKRMTESIMNGRDEMPAFGKKLSREQIAALVTYVRSLKQSGVQ